MVDLNTPQSIIFAISTVSVLFVCLSVCLLPVCPSAFMKMNFNSVLCPGLKGPPGASTVWIVCPFVRLSEMNVSIFVKVIPDNLIKQ